MDFWETIAGHELANTLQTEIPELAESLDAVNKQLSQLLRPKRQEVIEVANRELIDFITTRLNQGWRLAHSMPSKTGFTILVFETC